MAGKDDYEVRPNESATWYLAQITERLKAIEHAIEKLGVPVLATLEETTEPIIKKTSRRRPKR